MAFDIKYEVVKNDCFTELAHSQIVVTCTINTAERGGVSKVLGVSADARLTSLEALSGEAKLTGKVNYKILYLDGEGKLSGLDYFCDFADSIQAALIQASFKLTAVINIIDVDTTVGSDEITLSAVCDFIIGAVVTAEYRTLSELDAEYNIGEQTIQKINTSEISFEISEEVESGVNIDKVLLYESRVIALETAPMDGGVTVAGEAASDIIYISEGKVFTKTVIIPFKEELAVQKADGIYFSAKIKNARLILSGEEDNNILRIELLIAAFGINTYTESQKMLSDIFSEAVELKEETQICDTERYLFSRKAEASLTTEAGLEDNMKPVAKVMATPVSRNNLANLIAEDNLVTAEGLIVANVLYLDEEDKVGSVQVELPYSVKLDIEGITSAMILKGEAVASIVTAKSKGSIIEVKAELKLRVDAFSKEKLKFITAVSEGEQKTENPSGISIYFAGEEDTLWSIAKALNVSPKRLLANNPKLIEGIEKGMRIMVFREKKL